MQDLGRWMVMAGAGLTALGAIVWILGRAGFHGLPGDLRYESNGFGVYFPIVSCLVLSALLTAAMWLWRWFQRK